MSLKIQRIPESAFPDYRYDVMFKAYKWDLQAGEQSTVGDEVVLLDRQEAEYLAECAKALYHETVQMEHALKSRPDLAVKMGISKDMANRLHACTYEADKHVRFMRFDFHPTKDGWMISEVNSDVPAGYPEASVLPIITEQYFDGYSRHGNFGETLTECLIKHLPKGGTVAYVHDTHTVEDYQILHFLGDLLENEGYRSLYLAPNNVKWSERKAIDIDAIFRHYPMEWMECTEGIDWVSFLNADTPSCNHPLALLTQSKRLPLVWDELGVDICVWKRLLPETVCPCTITDTDNRILKPAFGRVGEGINIPGAVSAEENRDIFEAARKHPEQWVAQRMFQSEPIQGKHVCIGAFVVDGEFAGFYGRAGNQSRIDGNAADVPVLVKEKMEEK
ncbi:MAG: glutathionylspermidine synthase family protein [Oscillospiraceae bacterium]|nr:glutathionylspermidine synthase family protein [Oscillospiraceae bacterium]